MFACHHLRHVVRVLAGISYDAFLEKIPKERGVSYHRNISQHWPLEADAIMRLYPGASPIDGSSFFPQHH